MSVSVPGDLFYYEGEKPPPLPCRYEDDDGALITSIAGTTIAALVKCDKDATAEATVTCTNNDDGTFTIDWPTGTSAFALDSGEVEGSMKVDIRVTDSPRVWYMDRFSFPIKAR
jgi:hypothetical protein